MLATIPFPFSHEEYDGLLLLNEDIPISRKISAQESAETLDSNVWQQ
jgi:hypothetical protein